MTENHPITPPPELIEQWVKRYKDGAGLQPLFYSIFQAGADQELEAIIQLAGEAALPEKDRYFDGLTVAGIMAARRPKPPSLKEQALALLLNLKALRALTSSAAPWRHFPTRRSHLL
jgi:hypothetical protein